MTAGINLRAEADKDSTLLGVVDPGAVVEITGELSIGPAGNDYYPVNAARADVREPVKKTTAAKTSGPLKYTGPPVTYHIGAHCRADRHPDPPDHAIFKSGPFTSVFVQSGITAKEIHDYGAQLVLGRIFESFHDRTRSPEDFVKDVSGDVDTMVKAGVRHLQLLNEVNLDFESPVIQRVDDPNNYEHWGAKYGRWHLEVTGLLKARWPEILVGWPALSPGGDQPFQMAHDSGFRQSHVTFLNEADSVGAVSGSDWLAVHLYYLNDKEVDQRIEDLKGYRRRWPDKPIAITEHCNPQARDAGVQGRLAARFATKAGKIPGVLGSYFFCLSGTGWDPERNPHLNGIISVLRHEDGRSSGVIEAWK